MKSTRPFGFWLYFCFLVGLVSFAIVTGLLGDDLDLSHNWAAWVGLTILLGIAERTDLSYYEGQIRWGLSPAEAVLIPMLFALPPTQVVIGAVVAMVSMPKEWRDPSKQAFNVAQFGVAALIATLIFDVLQEPGAGFALRDALAATAAAGSFTVVTHVLVGIAIQLAGQGRVMEAFGDKRSTVLVNLVGALVVGLLAAGGFVAAPRTLVLFPLLLLGLYFGYRAVALQTEERRRIELLHSATRSLATSSNIRKALPEFLTGVAEVLSSLGARAVIDTGSGLVSSTVYEGNVIHALEPVGESVRSFLNFVSETKRPLVFGQEHDPVPDALKEGGAVRNVVAVPVLDGDAVTGLLMVSDRVGADDFGKNDVTLLEALANDLALTMQSYRLFEEVTEERERFHLLVESVSDYAIYMLDPQGHVVSWNAGAERILGYKAEEILDRHHSVFFPPDADGRWREELNEAAISGRSENEGKRIRRDGSMFVANEVITPVQDRDGDLKGYAKVTRDVTERIRTEAEKEILQTQLHQAQKLESVGQLAGGVAHDFNNLLSVITNATTFAIEALPKDHEAREDLNDVKSAAKRATELTRQLLIFSRRDLYKPEPLYLNEIVRQTLKLLSRALGEQIVVHAELDDSIGMVKADPGQLEQVLMNLAINARDAMPGGGTLTIETADVIIDASSLHHYVDLAPGPHVKLSVTDTGNGMHPAVLQKAFDPFFTTKPKGSGTGLGLATVYGIVKGAKGHINVMSTEGLGTTFEILLPETEAGAPATLEIPDVEPMRTESRGETILLVEDDQAVRAVTQRVLERNGYDVIAAPGSKDALNLFPSVKDRVNLLLTDIVMPDMTGVELARRVREAKPGLKVVYMSGYSPGVFSSGGAELEGELIQKPFEQEDLLGVIRMTLDPASGTIG